MAALANPIVSCGFKENLCPDIQCVLYTKNLRRYGYHNVSVFSAPDKHSFNKYLSNKSIFMAGLLDGIVVPWNNAVCETETLSIERKCK